ncbi:NAD(P)-dependent oxidoreductase [Aestuariirhabdus sp. Z084]|uniref:SDR family oxidoreductase n=1 Tax=Aestuariirhabdus haliotis TaxID=2918751 RepID=UPI00201B4140|nr:sugar nucleotide-binding protein [Aestuariirhabdus haliotis]MCL6415030.1 NAD(P)-dependent oxidoreductase [Aestuariirhabdus haliotis]MCL6418962.1 NAD(P)-dependent oxidoreductase [Aestuariirhabdus haliotis]
MKILIIGGSGQTGTCLRQRLDETRLKYYAPTKEQLDLTDTRHLQDVADKYRPDLVINCAGYRNASLAETEPSRCFALNRDAVGELATLCHERGAVLMHISSYMVFDGHKSDAYTEKDTANPLGVLGGSYWQGEQQIRERCERHIILRVGWMISERKFELLREIIAELKTPDPFDVLGNRYGNPTPADDAARVIVAIMQQLDCNAEPWGTYHYGGVNAVSESELAETILREVSQYDEVATDQLNIISATDEDETRKFPLNSRLDSTKLLHTFGIHANDWPVGLARLIKSFYV